MVEQALNALDKRQVEQADLYARPLGYLGEFFASSKGCKEAEAGWFNPYGELLYKQEVRELMPAETARTFLGLIAQKQVPGWVVELVDLKLLRTAAA